MQLGKTTLTLASGTTNGGSPFYLSKTPTALSAIKFTPPGSTTAQELLFVTNNYDLCTLGCSSPSVPHDNTVSVYAVNSDGTLTEQPNSPYTITASDPISVIAVNTMPANVGAIGGLFVYVGQGAGGGALFPFQVCWVANVNCSPQDVANNLLFPLTTCPALSCQVPPSAAGEYPVQMLVDPTNNFLYALSENSNQVFAFGIGTTTGKLTALQTLPIDRNLAGLDGVAPQRIQHRPVSLHVEQCVGQHYWLHAEYDKRSNAQSDHGGRPGSAERDGRALSQSGHRMIGSSGDRNPKVPAGV